MYHWMMILQRLSKMEVNAKEVPNVGIFEVTPDGSVTFTPDKQFVGTPDPVVVKRSGQEWHSSDSQVYAYC